MPTWKVHDIALCVLACSIGCSMVIKVVLYIYPCRFIYDDAKQPLHWVPFLSKLSSTLINCIVLHWAYADVQHAN